MKENNHNTENPGRKCEYCGTGIQGRSDKKFCDDHCRNCYHNTRKSKAKNFVHAINKILKTNRAILESFKIPMDRSRKVSKSLLLERGFDFTFSTQNFQDETGAQFNFCYEYRYAVIEGSCLIIKGQPYLKTEINLNKEGT